MKLTQDAYEALRSIYNPGEIAKAQQRLRDTQVEAERWQAEVTEINLARETLRDTAAQHQPEVREFLETEADLSAPALAQAEGKLATCRRKAEELQTFLRRAEKVTAWAR